MGDLYTRSPRMVDAIIKLHPGELCHTICQDAILKGFTEEELKKIAAFCHAELNKRENKNG